MKKQIIKPEAWRQLLSVALVLVCLTMMVTPVTAFAAGKSGKESQLEPYFHLTVDSSGNPNGIAVMVNIPNKGVYAFAGAITKDAYTNKSSMYLFNVANSQVYALSVEEKLSDSIYVWKVVGISSGAGASMGVLSAAAPVSGEPVTACYLGSELEYLYDTVSVSENAEVYDDGSALFEFNSSLTDIAVAPGFLWNANNQCVGVIVGVKIAYTTWFDSVLFNRSNTGSGNDNGSNNDGGNNNGDNNNGNNNDGNQPNGQVNHSSRDKAFDSSATALPEHDSSSVQKLEEKKNQIEKQKKIQKAIIIGSVVAVVSIAAVVAALLIRRKKAISGVSGPASYAHTEPVPTGVPVQNQGGSGRFGVSLSCKRGYYDGRIIPITEYMTFGRDPSCTVRYPADYAGVSRNHATLRVQSGKLILIDTSSTGTFLKRTGAAIPKGQPVQIGVGDVFYLGDQNNRFEVVRS